MSGTVVVGVEGTPSSHDALVWAARAAGARGAKLHLVHVYDHGPAEHDPALEARLEHRGNQLLKAESDRGRAVVRGLPVRTTLARGAVGRVLTDESLDAELLVVGAHPARFVERAFLGSRSYQIAAGAHCPVAVVPHLAAPVASRVVVGVDGSPDSALAVELGAAEADRVGGDLHVVHAWEESVAFTGLAYRGEGAYTDRLAQEEEVVLAASAAGLGERYPDLHVVRHLVPGRAAEVLRRMSEQALLLVVGSRGRQGVARMLLGSVSHAVVLEARCPVLVART